MAGNVFADDLTDCTPPQRIHELEREVQSLREQLELSRRLVERYATDERDRFILDTIQDGVFVIQHATFIYVNPALARLLGYSVKELQGISYLTVVAPEDRKRISQMYEKTVAGKEMVREYELALLHKDQQTIIPAISHVAQVPYQGELAGIGTIKDISAQKRFEAMISRIKKEWMSIVDSIPELIILTDASGVILRCNKTAVERLNLTFRDMIGKPIAELLLGQTDAFGSLMSLQGEVTLPRLPGCFSIASYPLMVENLIDGIVFVLRDITERKRIEESMTTTQRLADLGTLAAGIAHELNSPFQIITGQTEDLLNDLRQGTAISIERLVADLEMVHRNGWRGAKIIQSLLQYSRPATGQLEEFDLNLIIRETLLLIEHQLRSWANIRLVTELEEPLPLLKCNRNQIAQIIINLLTNARDAIHSNGQIFIQTRFDEKEQKLVLEISDTGCGMAPEILAHIFVPFFTTKPAGQGTGLGLSLIQSMVLAHQGTIDVTSEFGSGTTFTIVFPLNVSQSTPQNGG